MKMLTRLLCVSALLMTVAFAESLDETRKKAEAGDATAQSNLGLRYVNGDGVPKDIAEAVKWYRRSADQGNADAQFALGLNYYFGIGVPKDSAEAVKWNRKAADQGNADAQHNLGLTRFPSLTDSRFSCARQTTTRPCSSAKRFNCFVTAPTDCAIVWPFAGAQSEMRPR